MSDKPPAMNPPLIKHLEYNGMTDYRYQILLDTEQKIPKLEADTKKFLQKLISVTGSLPDKSEPLSLEQYIT